MTMANLTTTPERAGTARHAAVQGRVDYLHTLATQLVSRYLTLAETMHAEHELELWQRVRTPSGDPYPSEEVFWEHAVGVKRRTGFQLVAVGRMLSRLRLPAADRAALSTVGLHKMDVLVPILSMQTTVDGAREWIAKAHALGRDDLRAAVQNALGRPAHAPTDRVCRYVINAMPDLTSRELASEFFTVGASVVESKKGLAILIAGMAEAVSTWHTHAGETTRSRLTTHDHELIQNEDYDADPI